MTNKDKKNNKKRNMAIILSAVLLSLSSVSIGLGVYFGTQNNTSNSGSQDSPNVPNVPNVPNAPDVPNVPDNQNPSNPDEGTLHAISLNDIQSAISPLNIIAKSKLFKDSVNNMYKALNEYNWKGTGDIKADFEYDVGNSKMNKNFYKLNQEVGIVGEYTYTKGQLSDIERLNQLIKCTPSLIDIVDYDMKQKYLPNFDSQDEIGATDMTGTADLNDIILKNQFGFLPSNLSQLFYYMDYSGIATILGLETQGVKDIKANYNDGTLIPGTTDRNKAYIKLLVTDNSDNKYIYEINKDNTQSLKSDYDFFKYVYDRTFAIHWPKMYISEIVRPQTSAQDTYVNMKVDGEQGTCFVIDRVVNKQLEDQGKYQFLVGSNAHVLDISKSFNKSKYSAGYSKWNPNQYIGGLPNKTYNKFWDGGWFTSTYADSNVPSSGLPNQNPQLVNKTEEYSKHYVINNRRPDFTYGARASIGNNENPDKVTGSIKHKPTGIKNDNFIDTIWYTPELVTKGSWTLENLNSTVGPVFDPVKQDDLTEHQKTEGNRWTGTISNAGGDFAIAKITLERDTIKSILPSLDKILGTNEEKDWYVGLGSLSGKSTMPSANSTLFAGGYPNSQWDSVKSIGGKIVSQKRFLDVNVQAEGNVVKFWEKYDKDKNAKFNKYRGLVDWYDKYENFQMPSMTKAQNEKYNPHGMEIQKVMQQSLISFSDMLGHQEKDVLLPGSSGSLIINSRFEPVAVNCILGNELNNPNSYYNYGMLFSNYTKDNKSFNVKDQVIKQLEKENTFTIKMRPNK